MNARKEGDDRREALLEEAAAWRFLHDLFRTPGPGQWNWLQSNTAKKAWRMIAESLGPSHPPDLPLPGNFESFEEGFLAAFEVGAPKPPCPLIESHWNTFASVPKVLHENMLFYKQFGLELRSSANETADHLRHQLEFLHYLCRFQALAEPGEAAHQAARAHDDYLQRHLAHWLPRAARAAEEAFPGSWQEAWMRLLEAFCRAAASSCKGP